MSKIVVEKKKIKFEKPLDWKVMPGQEGISVAICDELDMVLQIDDDSPEQQVRQIMEALRLLYEDLEQSGELEAFFEHHGVRFTMQEPRHEAAGKVSTKKQEIQPAFEMLLGTLDVAPSSLKAHV